MGNLIYVSIYIKVLDTASGMASDRLLNQDI